ncbi:carbohydrate ABC transporter permease [Agrobacterium salinitolerans]|uniref:Carbohydrate ABC transporter permease n=1 Tax=Agrobacterium salinitolerans TaxID=1183413 RepID=A0A9X3R1C7_9HYPH|nr:MULTISPECIES: carbohydrate ABC transporter permease [Agrobacterium]MCZ7854627.1 carbohydrate ABC transporter permease [Agrobacterium salinitolerans]MCZ7893972.1 carbohydrate ABC transporter permease [Agrobacterium salinitolerans]MCZ7939923.1 carbohydrate ABC transporter permease [Agrobacterium salinitolerans]TRA84261.1 carbohydrate ABC transporter permease [Agrobacterium salinitolerans]
MSKDHTKNRNFPSAIFSTSGGGDRKWALIGAYLCLAIFVLIFLFPPYYMIVTSLKSNGEIASVGGNPWMINQGATLEQYTKLIRDTPFVTFFLNSIVVAVCSVAITMVVSIMAAYSLARMHFFGAGALATGIFLTYLVPGTLLFIPLFRVVAGLGLINSIWGLILIYPTFMVPFCTWLMIGYFGSIPKELDEAARIDGCNHFQLLVKVFIPVAMPGIVAAIIFAFTAAWGQFLYPTAYIYSTDQNVLTSGIMASLIRGDSYFWGELMAAGVLAAAPPIIIFVFLMDYYVSGLTSGATKG